MNETGGFYKLEGFCRSYWECKSRKSRGISEAHCCPVNQTFSPEGKCVDDPACDNLEECTTLPGDVIMIGKKKKNLINYFLATSTGADPRIF